MFKNKFLRFAVLTLAFIMLLSFAAFAEETETEEKTTLTFGVFSDIHNVTSYMTNVMNNFETLAGGNENIDGIAMVGDIAYLDTNDTPVAATYNIVKNNADLAYFIAEDKLAFAMGNHEFPLNANADPMASLSRQVFTEQVGYAPESHHVFSGYHFITGGPNTYDGKMTAEQEQYVMDEITAALQDGTEKPVFVLIHHPIDGTLHGSGSTRHSDEFVEFLKSEPRIIVFDGHMHYPTSDPRSIYQVKGGATFIYTSSVHGGNNLSNPYATQRHDKAFPSQAYLMQVDTETNVVTLKRFYVDSTPSYLEEGDWVLDIPAMIEESKKAEDEIDTDVYKFTYALREANSVAPVYNEDDAITVTSLTTKTISISFPEATPGADGEDNLVGYYKIDLYNKNTGKTVTKKIISDYFLKTKRTSFTCSFDTLEYSTDYTISVTPLNMWFVEGAPITLDFTSEDTPSIIGRIMGYDGSYYAAPVTLNSAGNGYSFDIESAFQLTDENNKKLSGLYVVSNDNFATQALAYAYGLVSEREAIYQKADGKLPFIDDGSKGLFYPGKFSSNGWIGAPTETYFYSDTQWISRLIKAYFSATDDTDGTEGGKTAAEKKLDIIAEMINTVKEQNQHVIYALNTGSITPISDVSSLKFGFYLNAVYSQITMTINNNAYRLTAYVMDKEGNVTTHSTSVGGITMKTGAVSYATFNFKTAEWDVALPEDGYFVGYRVYPYDGIDNPEDITLTTTKASVDEINNSERLRFVAMPSTYTVDIPKAEAPKGITADGMTFNGLDKNTAYAVAPYSIVGADNAQAIEVKGVTSYTLPEGSAGLYGIYIKGNGVDINNSDAVLVYVRGAYANRQNLHDKNSSGYYKLSTTKTPGSFSYVGSWSTHSTFSGGISTTGDHISNAQAKTLYTAYSAADATDESKATAFANMLSSSKLKNTHLQYNMAFDEIIPISEVNKYSYKVSKQRGGFTYNNQVSEFIALVMDSNGVVTEYKYQHVASKLGNTVTKTVDFKNKESTSGKWVDDLPDDGYLVGFKLMIYANLDNFANVAISTSTTGTRYLVHPATSYVIDIPQADAPTGITVEGTTFKGLNASKTYAIAPYTLNGIDTTLEKTVTGVTEYNVAASFENKPGTYAIYFKGNDYYTNSVHSNICYIQGTIAEKQDIIFSEDGKYNVYPVKWAKINSWSTGDIVAPLSEESAGTFYVSCLKSTIMSTWFFPASTNTATNKENLPKVRYAYAFNPDEIPTVSELGGFKFRIGGQNSSLVTNAKAKVNFVVLHPDGTITNHSCLTKQYQFKINVTNSFTIDFQSIAGLPEKGYVLGFEVFPFAEVVTMSPESTSFSNLGIYFYFDSYTVTATKANAPTGITVEGTTFSGLDATKTYTIAPYTVVGIIEDDKKSVTGVTSVDVTTLYENPAGIYGIYFDADVYNGASDIGSVVYVKGSLADRKALGELTTYTYTWNSGANSVEYTAAAFEKVTEATKEWSLGKIAGGDYFIYNGTDYNSYKCDWMYSTPSSKALYEAEQAADGSYESLQKQAEATLEAISFRYAYTPDEIIHIDEVSEMKFAAALGATYINVINPHSKYVLYVMNTDGTISAHTYVTEGREIDGDIGNVKNQQSLNPRRDFKDLPEDGWIIGYKFYPYGELESKNITYREANIANTSTQYVFNFKTPLVKFANSYSIEASNVKFGMSILLDGKVGVKVTATDCDDISGLTVSNVEGTDNYVDFGTNNYATFYFDPKDVSNATVTFDVNYTDEEGERTKSFNLAVADYIETLKSSDDEEVVKLATAFETYFNAAKDYFYTAATEIEALPDFTAEELEDLESKSTHSKLGTVGGLEFSSTSLILEEDTTIRHYFKITDASIETDADLAELYTVAGGAALKLSSKTDTSGFKYAYVDISNIASNELATVKTAIITDSLGATVTVDFNALAYVDLCLDKDNAKLLNVAKALYRYSVASDSYMAD